MRQEVSYWENIFQTAEILQVLQEAETITYAIQLQILIVLISLLMNGWKDISYARGMNSGIS